MLYQEMVDWGQTHEESDRKAQVMEETTDRSEDKVRRLEDRLNKLQAKQNSSTPCQTFCTPRHAPDQLCPGTKCTE